jgi:CRP-like cAMP-binding protein
MEDAGEELQHFRAMEGGVPGSFLFLESGLPEEHFAQQRERAHKRRLALTYEGVSRYFAMPLPRAARVLQVSATWLKMMCRRLGIFFSYGIFFVLIPKVLAASVCHVAQDDVSPPRHRALSGFIKAIQALLRL